MNHDLDIVGRTIPAVVTRVEHYGLYLAHGDATILVLIPDVSDRPIRDLTQAYRPGETVEVHVLRYIEDYAQYKGTMTGREH